MLILGVDFTSAPRPRKRITVAEGWLDDAGLHALRLRECRDWAAFEACLHQPGPWCGGFDFPFGLPRALITQLGWPAEWAALVKHLAALGKPAFRAALDEVRSARPMGQRYLHRAADLPARSHSPMKLVNPPVGLMFLAGAPRLLAANVSIPGMHRGDPGRIALEAYPALLAREFTRESYKRDGKNGSTPARLATRECILTGLCAGSHRLALPPPLRETALLDGSGDNLDALLAMLAAAWCWQRRAQNYGLPPDFDPVEGWIATCAPEP
ncbi:MAG: DUF429 domain-containing protein [Candidatus Dactylopiibacterium carminicum]|uniref:DUF429 domain-containing protein n=1 Tax=Candidatus Dactylopiibacterium carminicum TaxID=857335 RepID=A0A272ENS9_9RHOO|nr:DUF429 domain-containing protein [Candidatus Dactylopiibacterium carminicum]KAF7599538.1 DUF429 domain-containing protein [Candidatus Dactylopiibacterium carminicum]PAS91777.1 MAG: DUF429 domain-containing protein [Candidatus Dactylopiibacterium carminicum]PAS99543.1 MAG: DUF429 domain-containing protein [Candidatus Dactylopiibacterium carminicum]